MAEDLLAGERLDRVNEDLVLIQKEDGLTFGTDAFLLASYMTGREKYRAAELGTGTGIISLLCAAKKRFAKIHAFEVQPDFATLATRNVSYNGLSSVISVHDADVRDVKAATLGYEVDVVFTNPPYMRTDSGKRNDSDYKYVARHEVCGTIGDFCAAAYRLLKHGGSFYCVYRPDRLADLMEALTENRLSVKQMTFVHADQNTEPSMVLLRAVKGGASGMRVSPPLFLYEETADAQGARKMSLRAERIYQTMSFDF